MSAAAPGRMVFDPPEMLALAGTLSSAADRLSDAAARLRGAVSGAGDLPPGVLAAVQAETASASRLLDAAADTYSAGSREVRRQAEQARAADSAAGTAGKVLKSAGAIVLEVDKHINGGRVHKGAQGLLAAKLVADLAGVKALQTVLRWDDWRAAYRDARIRPGDTALTRLRKTYHRRWRDTIAANVNGIRIGREPDTGRRVPGLSGGDDGLRPTNTGLKRLSRVAAGLVPFAGTGADVANAYADGRAVAGRATPRNVLAAASSGLHVAGDGLQAASAGPQAVVTLPLALGADAAATVGDAGVLAIDTAPLVAKFVKQQPVAELGRRALKPLGAVLPRF